MRVQIEEIGPVEKKMTVTIPKELVMNELDFAYKDLRKKVKINGFRQGKVPISILKRHYETQVEGDVVSKLVNDSCFKGLEKNNMDPVSRPVIDNGGLKEGEEFTYSAKFEVKPDIEVKGYIGMELRKEMLHVSEEDVNNRLSELQQSSAQLHALDVQCLLKSGDFAVIDYAGFLDGKPIEEEKVIDHLFELGSGSFFPEFEEQLLGLQKGDEKDISVTMPKSYQRTDLAGKEVLFMVKVKEIKEKIIPELNDDFAKDLGEFDTLEELKEKIRENLERKERFRIESDLRGKVLDKLVEKNSFEVPPSLVEQHLNYMVNEIQARLTFQGLNMEEAGLSFDRLKEEYASQAEKEVRGSLLLEVIARKESIDVDEGDVEKRIDEIAKNTGQKVENVRKFYMEKNQRDRLEDGLINDKTLDFLIESAKIKEEEKGKNDANPDSC